MLKRRKIEIVTPARQSNRLNDLGSRGQP